MKPLVDFIKIDESDFLFFIPNVYNRGFGGGVTGEGDEEAATTTRLSGPRARFSPCAKLLAELQRDLLPHFSCRRC